MPAAAAHVTMSRGPRNTSSTDTAAFAALLNELRGPLTGVAAVSHLPAVLCVCFAAAVRPRCGSACAGSG